MQDVTSTAVSPPRRVETGRHYAARVILYLEAALLAFVALQYLTGTLASGAVAYLDGGLAALGTVILVVGATRARNDGVGPAVATDRQRVPWDWTDFVMFWPGAFTAASLLASIALPVVDAIAGTSDAAVRTAAESFAGNGAYYAGALFNVFVLVRMRRGGGLTDLGWRRFRWWWLLTLPVMWFVTLQVAGFLQDVNQNLFPNVANGQCVVVRHDYSHFYALAILVVCVMAPLAEETIFRGFVYGWMRRWSPVAIAIPMSAVIFSALHEQLVLFLPLFFVGCVLALLYQGSRSLLPGVLMHAAFNLPGIIAILGSPSC